MKEIGYEIRLTSENNFKIQLRRILCLGHKLTPSSRLSKPKTTARALTEVLKCRPKARVSRCASLRHLCPLNVCKLPAYRQNLREVRQIYQVTTERQKQVSVPR